MVCLHFKIHTYTVVNLEGSSNNINNRKTIIEYRYGLFTFCNADRRRLDSRSFNFYRVTVTFFKLHRYMYMYTFCLIKDCLWSIYTRRHQTTPDDTTTRKSNPYICSSLLFVQHQALDSYSPVTYQFLDVLPSLKKIQNVQKQNQGHIKVVWHRGSNQLHLIWICWLPRLFHPGYILGHSIGIFSDPNPRQRRRLTASCLSFSESGRDAKMVLKDNRATDLSANTVCNSKQFVFLRGNQVYDNDWW